LLHLNSIGASYGFFPANAAALTGFDVIRRFLKISQNPGAIALPFKAHDSAIY
jgi:hypothetical protein